MSANHHRIEPIYRPSKDGPIVVYSGDLALTIEGGDRVVAGQLELELSPRSNLQAHLVSSDPLLGEASWKEPDPPVAIPPGADLDPRVDPELPERPDGADWLVDWTIRVNRLAAGDLPRAERLMFHVAGELTNQVLPRVDTGGVVQGQLGLTQPGWQLVLVTVNDCAGEHDFSYVVEATPAEMPMDVGAVDRLRERLFVLLSLVAGREVGIGPAAGLDGNDHVCWAEWGSPRLRPGRAGVRWCPEHLVPDALPVLADGFAQLDVDAGLERVVTRAIQYMLAANSSEPLDVRIPVACSGLELLGWALLQRHQWLSRDALGKLSAGAIVRLLLQWAGIPVGIPEGFDALAVRQKRLGQPDWMVPDVVFNVRNGLVHPPRRLDEPEWPTAAELLEAWQLGTWYLELAIIRVLGYQGEYWSRLRLGRSQWETEPVPWATP